MNDISMKDLPQEWREIAEQEGLDAVRDTLAGVTANQLETARLEQRIREIEREAFTIDPEIFQRLGVHGRESRIDSLRAEMNGRFNQLREDQRAEAHELRGRDHATTADVRDHSNRLREVEDQLEARANNAWIRYAPAVAWTAFLVTSVNFAAMTYLLTSGGCTMISFRRRPQTIVHDHQGCVIAAQLGSPCLGIASYIFPMPEDAMARLTMNCNCQCHDQIGRTIRI